MVVRKKVARVSFSELSPAQKVAAVNWFRKDTPSYREEFDSLWAGVVARFTSRVPYIVYSTEKRGDFDWGILVVSDRVKKMTGTRLQKMIRSEMLPAWVYEDEDERFDKAYLAVQSVLSSFVQHPTSFERVGKPPVVLQDLMDMTVRAVEEPWFRDQCQDWRDEIEKQLQDFFEFDPKTGEAYSIQ